MDNYDTNEALPPAQPAINSPSPELQLFTMDEIAALTAAKSKSTPRKRKQNTGDTGSTPASKKRKAPAVTNSGTTERKQRKKSVRESVITIREIPRTYEECDSADKQLVDMRDAKKSWPEIRAMWLQETGEDTATSTLPNRYIRLKGNFSTIREEDRPRLLQSKIDVEDEFNKRKWEDIADAVFNSGGERYDGETLKLQYKKMMTAEGILPPAGIYDADFDGVGSSAEEDI